ncbi:MAG: helix-turn-helix domain-containing protein [Synergistaceae bacterium]|nr:helix-turn-helix domain-containing protein [Synergistaceae bacterium]
MNRAYKFRIYTNKEQRIIFAKTFGCVRFVYNRMLSDKIKYYQQAGKSLSVTPAQYKSQHERLKECRQPSTCQCSNELADGI